MIARILGTSRFVILMAVIGSYVAATTLIIYGVFAVIHVLLKTLAQGSATPEGATALAVIFIEMIDIFLLGVVLYITAAGLYKLFIGSITLPEWLEVDSLDALKQQLIRVVIVLLAVTFLGHLVTLHSGLDVLYSGIAVALVIAALVYTLKHGYLDKAANAPPQIKQQIDDEP